MPDKLNSDLSNIQTLTIHNMRWGFNSFIVFLLIFLLFYSWLTLQDIKQDQSKELSIIAELSGNSLDAYFLHYERALKLLAD
jgi:hypothetical protein